MKVLGHVTYIDSRLIGDFLNATFRADASHLYEYHIIMFKPFKAPLLKRIEKKESVDLTISDSEDDIQQRPFKKRRIHVVEDSPKRKLPTASVGVAAPRKPLLVVKNPIETKCSQSTSSDGLEGYYLVLWYVIAAS